MLVSAFARVHTLLGDINRARGTLRLARAPSAAYLAGSGIPSLNLPLFSVVTSLKLTHLELRQDMVSLLKDYYRSAPFDLQRMFSPVSLV